MADLTDKQTSQSIKITGADPSTGVESNYLNVDSGGAITSLIKGGTDGTSIGNVGDSLKVSASISGVSEDVITNVMFSFGVVANMASAGTDNRLVILKNPVGSGKVIYIFRIHCGVNIVNVESEFKLFSMPTVTANGTAITIGSRNINGGSPASVAQAFALPTVTANGTQLSVVVTGQNNNSPISAEDYSLAIQPGGTLLITGNPSSNNRAASITITWKEV